MFKYGFARIQSENNFAMYNSYCRYVNIELEFIYSSKTSIKNFIQMDLELTQEEFVDFEINNKKFMLENYPKYYSEENQQEVLIEPVQINKLGIFIKIFKQSCQNKCEFVWQTECLYLTNFELVDKE